MRITRMPLEDWRLLPVVLLRDGGTGLALEGGAASPPILRQISVPEFPGLANEARPGIGGCSSESGMHNGWRGTVQDGTGWALVAVTLVAEARPTSFEVSFELTG